MESRLAHRIQVLHKAPGIHAMPERRSDNALRYYRETTRRPFSPFQYYYLLVIIAIIDSCCYYWSLVMSLHDCTSREAIFAF